jgi:flagellar basal body rod protein FlgG
LFTDSVDKFIGRISAERQRQMTISIYATLSGLTAYEKKLDVTANNIANVDTDEFKKSRVIMDEDSPSGVIVSISRVNTPGVTLPPDNWNGNGRESSNVEIEEEMVNLVTAKNGYSANLKALKIEDEILGTLLDIVDR